jgi:hypothetical protein
MELPTYIPRGRCCSDVRRNDSDRSDAPTVAETWTLKSGFPTKRFIEKTQARIEQCDYGDTNAWAYFVGKCYIMRALDRFITEFESPGLHRPEQWKTFVTTMTYGRNRISFEPCETCKW